MKKPAFIFLAFVLLSAGWACPGISYGQTKANITINAQVSDTLDFSWNMHRLLGPEDPNAGDLNQTVMDFKKLYEVDPLNYPGKLFSDIWFSIFLYTSATQPYQIKQDSTPLMTLDGLHNLNNSFVVIPDYIPGDKWGDGTVQGNLDTGEQLGSPSRVYKQESPGTITLFTGAKSHIIRLYYSIPSQPTQAVPGWQPLTTSQPAGNYQGTVTISIVPKST
jgi:hypothetical protein